MFKDVNIWHAILQLNVLYDIESLHCVLDGYAVKFHSHGSSHQSCTVDIDSVDEQDELYLNCQQYLSLLAYTFI